MSQTIRAAALNPMGHTHFTDHLAAVCVVMDIPLIFCDEIRFEQAKKLYPGLKSELVAYDTLTPAYIVEHYDAVFVSEMWSHAQIRARFGKYEKAIGKKLRVVHCPHGFSDKGFWFALCVEQDLTFVYGQNMLDLIAEHVPDVPEWAYVVVGNPRKHYYERYKDTFDAHVQEDVLQHFDAGKPVIIYAPTWRDSESSTSFFSAVETILGALPDDYNLLIKLHPNLEHDDENMLEVMRIVAEHEQRPNVQFLSEYPLIYPLLSACDVYVGDHSAVGYDYLAFDRPMFFLNESGRTHEDRSAYLYRCGHVIDSQDYSKLFERISVVLDDENPKISEQRRNVYAYTFADTNTSQLVAKITDALRI